MKNLLKRYPVLKTVSPVILFVMTFYLVGRILITNFYNKSLPHYDSVGLYTNYFKLLNLLEAGDISEALQIAAQNSLSILQNYFTIIFSPFLEKSMSSFHLYNTMMFIPAVCGAYTAARTFNLSRSISFFFILCLLLPGGLFYWSLGVFDLRRDIGTLFALTGALFFLISFLMGQFSNERRRLITGLMGGICAGLCLISRDTAFGFLFGVVILPVLFLWLNNLRQISFLDNLKSGLVPALGFLPFLFMWGLIVPDILQRISNPYLFYGAGADPLVSLTANIGMPFFLITDLGHRYHWQKAAFITPILLFGYAALMAWLWRNNRSSHEDKSLQKTQSITLILISVWIVLYVCLFLAFVVQWKPLGSSPIIPTAAPFYYSIPAFYVFVLAILVRSPRELLYKKELQICSLAFVLVLAGMIARPLSRAPQYPKWYVDAHTEFSKEIAKGGKQAVVAELADDFRIPALQLYAEQANVPPLKRLTFEYDGYLQDFAVAGPDTASGREEFTKTILTAVQCNADYITMYTNIEKYKVETSPKFLTKYGETLILQLEKDFSNAPVTTIYAGENTPFMKIIDNQSKSHCQDPS